MAELKTQRTDASVDAFIEGIAGEAKKRDARDLVRLMQDVTGEAPAMWGGAIVGFGERRLKYDTGRELDWMVTGFSPRKANLSLYLPGGFERLEPFLKRLGPHKTGAGCLYIKRLSDVDSGVLRELVESAVSTTRDEG